MKAATLDALKTAHRLNMFSSLSHFRMQSSALAFVGDANACRLSEVMLVHACGCPGGGSVLLLVLCGQ